MNQIKSITDNTFFYLFSRTRSILITFEISKYNTNNINHHALIISISRPKLRKKDKKRIKFGLIKRPEIVENYGY